MAGKDLNHKEDRDSPLEKTIKTAGMGLAAGTVYGALVAIRDDVPKVEGNAALPGLMRTLKVCGNYGLTLAALGGIYAGVEQLMLQKRRKRDYINGAVGAFLAGAAVFGFKRRSISSAISAGSSLAFTSAVLDYVGGTPSTEHSAYTAKKTPFTS